MMKEWLVLSGINKKIVTVFLLAVFLLFSNTVLAATSWQPAITVKAPKVVTSQTVSITVRITSPVYLKYLTVGRSKYVLPKTKTAVKTVKVPLKIGKNTITVKAVNRKNKYTVKSIIVYRNKPEPLQLKANQPVIQAKQLPEVPASLNGNKQSNYSENTNIISLDYEALPVHYANVPRSFAEYTLNLTPEKEIQTLQVKNLPQNVVGIDFYYRLPSRPGEAVVIQRIRGQKNIEEAKIYFRYGSGDYYLSFNVKEGSWNFSSYKVVKFRVTGITDRSDILPSGLVNSDDPVIIELAKKLTAGLDTAEEKIKAIHDFVAETVAYNDAEGGPTEDEKNSLQVLRTRTGVCRHYSYLFAALARAAGIPTRTVVGIAGGAHEWNEVYVNGKWLAVDVTWDDQENKPATYDFFLKEKLPYHYEISTPEAYILGESYGGIEVRYLEQ